MTKSNSHKEIQKQVLLQILQWGGYRRKQVPWKNQIFTARLIDPPLWDSLSLSISAMGVYYYTYSQKTTSPPSALPYLHLGDHLLGQYLFEAHLERGHPPPEICELSGFVQILYYSQLTHPFSLSQWERFFQEKASLILSFGEEKLERHFSAQLHKLFSLPLSPRRHLLLCTADFLELFSKVLQQQKQYHLFLPYLKGLSQFFSLLPSHTLFWEEEEEEALFSLEKLFHHWQRIWKNMGKKHYLERTPPEQVFWEKGKGLFS